MKRLLVLITVVAGMLLSGCAATAPTTQSTVTAFHVWQSDVKDKSFTFDRTKEQEQSLEYQSYERFVEDALLLQSFTEKTANKPARFKVAFSYDVKKGTRVVMQPREFADPFWYMNPRRRYYDPFGYDTMQPVQIDVYERQLKLKITDATLNKAVYEVTVNNEGRTPDLVRIMPYLVQSAFRNFPGPSGVPQQVILEVDEPF
jgi:hypothetical protein